MDQVSKPLIALLVGTVLFFALWIVALKPGSGSAPSGGHGLGQYQSAVNAANNAVALANHVSPQQGNLNVGQTTSTTAAATSSATSATDPAAAAATASRSSSSTAAHSSPGATQERVEEVTQALLRHRVVALLFYNPAGADDRAVKQELAAIPTARGRVVKLVVPVTELTQYPVVTDQVAVSGSPTLVLIDARRQATSLVGYASQFELAQRISDAMAVHPLG